MGGGGGAERKREFTRRKKRRKCERSPGSTRYPSNIPQSVRKCAVRRVGQSQLRCVSISVYTWQPRMSCDTVRAFSMHLLCGRPERVDPALMPARKFLIVLRRAALNFPIFFDDCARRGNTRLFSRVAHNGGGISRKHVRAHARADFRRALALELNVLTTVCSIRACPAELDGQLIVMTWSEMHTY